MITFTINHSNIRNTAPITLITVETLIAHLNMITLTIILPIHHNNTKHAPRITLITLITIKTLITLLNMFTFTNI